MADKTIDGMVERIFAPYYKAVFYSDKFVEKIKAGLQAQEKDGTLKDLEYVQFQYEIKNGLCKKAVVAKAIVVKENKEIMIVIGEYVGKTGIQKWSGKYGLRAVENKSALIDKIIGTGFKGDLNFFE
jgi:hypothetical protein